MGADTAEIPIRLAAGSPRDVDSTREGGAQDAGAARRGDPPSEGPIIEYAAAVYPGPQAPVQQEFAQAIKKVEDALGIPVWVLIQDAEPFPSLDERVVIASRQARTHLTRNQKVGLLIDSPGGDARSAYQIAMIFRKLCRGVTAIIPRRAKSAATLLALSADEIAFGTDGELGPLDAQVFDPEREDVLSALDEFQTLERLHAFALEAVDRSMLFLLPRTGKKIDTLMPLVSRFVGEMVRPLFEKIDAVHYTQMARALKVAEDYAVRLLRPRHSVKEAQRIARHLVERYSEHGFVIDAKEAQSIGLKVAELSVDQIEAVDALTPMLEHGLTVLGCLKERKTT